MLQIRTLDLNKYHTLKSYKIIPGDIQGFLGYELRKFDDRYNPLVNSKHLRLIEMIKSTRSSLEKSLENNDIDILITRFGTILFKISPLEKSPEYLFKALTKFNYLKNPSNISIINEMLNELKTFNFHFELENKIFKQLPDNLSSKITPFYHKFK